MPTITTLVMAIYEYKELKSAGIKVTIRSQFGIDIDAACGQLYGNYQKTNSQ